MADPKRREVAESVFNRNQRREAEINEALRQEARLAVRLSLKTCTGCERNAWKGIKKPKPSDRRQASNRF
jgi:hypothetical protein